MVAQERNREPVALEDWVAMDHASVAVVLRHPARGWRVHRVLVGARVVWPALAPEVARGWGQEARQEFPDCQREARSGRIRMDRFPA